MGATFSFRPGLRENVGLLIGLAGASGSGKTFTALRLAKGLANGRKFVVLDTEARRALHYADQFQFDHADIAPPFRPERYLEAILAAEKAGYPVIVVDSMSHEHAGEGGLLDWHEEELNAMAGADFERRNACNMRAWIKPKMEHKKMVQRLLQVRAHLVLCFRAEEKIEISKDKDGKTVIVPKQSLTGKNGWIPICEKNLPYELTASLLFTADAPGVPKPIKLQEQHKAFFPLDKPVTDDAGARLAAWAKGVIPAGEKDLRAAKTPAELAEAWGRVPAGEKKALEKVKDECKATFTPPASGELRAPEAAAAKRATARTGEFQRLAQAIETAKATDVAALRVEVEDAVRGDELTAIEGEALIARLAGKVA